MYVVILSRYKEDTALGSGETIELLPAGMPSEAITYNTLEEAQSAHPDKVILDKKQYQILMDTFSAMIKRLPVDFMETDEFKLKYKKTMLGHVKPRNPKKKPWWRLGL